MANDTSITDRVTVALGERSYDILVGTGLIDGAGTAVRQATGARRAAIVSDHTVSALYGERLATALRTAGLGVATFVFPPGEATKSFPVLEELLDRLLDFGIERSDCVVALGGGVIGDLAGLAASLVKRGVAFVQIPTTLLAQVDSSVGGKTGINTRQGKNLVGSFYQPRLVLADTGVLDSLPARELKAGYAEIVKYGLIDDASFFAWLETHGTKVLAENSTERRQAIVTACRAKARIVALDERESGPRALLNLGHTFAHALEAETGFSDRLLHGEAVALGLVLAFAFSAAQGLLPQSEAQRVEAHLKATGLKTRLSEIEGAALSPAALVAHMRQDKKITDGRTTFVLAHGIGRAFLARDVDLTYIEQFLSRRPA